MKIEIVVADILENHKSVRNRVTNQIVNTTKLYLVATGIIKVDKNRKGAKVMTYYIFTDDDVQRLREAMKNNDPADFEQIVEHKPTMTRPWLTPEQMAEMKTGQLIDYLTMMNVPPHIARKIILCSDEEYGEYFNTQRIPRDPVSRMTDIKNRFQDLTESQE